MTDLFPGDYWPPLLELLPHPLGHLSTVTAHPLKGPAVPLAVRRDSLEVTFSEDWAPFAQIKCELPADTDAPLDLLDPRLNCRLSVAAGYAYPNGREEVLPLADVGLRERPVRRPDDVVALTAASDEARAQDYRIMHTAAFPRTGVNEAVRWLLGFALAPDVPVLVSDFADGTKAAGLAEIEAGIGDDVWSILDDVAARAGVRIWCDETRTWRIANRPANAGLTSLELTVGKDGTILKSETRLTREEWFNAAVLRYRWKTVAGVEQVRHGRALVSSGPHAVQTVGAKVYFDEIERPVSQSAADAAAASKLRTLTSRGRSLHLTAGAAYWLRPNHTIRVQLPTGAPEKHLVQSVTFRPHTGDMDIVTRQPQNVTITNGE